MNTFSLILIVAPLLITGCVQSGGSHIYHKERGGAVCGELGSGEKQTFPSIEELNNTPDANYLHDGPCYDY